ncbi:MAG: carboxypeptidase-like regulatory domain-containing protein [Deltaproteobacteria bacterium]|nr:carboxypeptidase-like regulatory domain-containing protein [Deltaproteobacteria bacterium]
MARYGMVIDVEKCTGCYSCFLACKDEFCGNNYPGYAASQPAKGHYWMKVVPVERGTTPKVKLDYIPTPCQQCENAPCISGGAPGAVYRRPDGIVIIDPEKAKGDKGIVSSCPYRVIYWNEEENVAQKCNFCAHLLDKGWKEPRCVETCPTDALIFGDLDDPKSEIAKKLKKGNTETLHPEFATRPSVCYIGLPKKFIAGEVVFADKKDEAATGVKVTLVCGSKKMETATDHYGDFEFDGLDSNKEYKVRLEYAGYKTQEMQVKTLKDINLGEIVLAR